MLPLVFKCGALSLEFLCLSGWLDLEAGLPLTMSLLAFQAGLGLPHLSEGGAYSGTGLTCFAPPLPTACPTLPGVCSGPTPDFWSVCDGGLG